MKKQPRPNGNLAQANTLVGDAVRSIQAAQKLLESMGTTIDCLEVAKVEATKGLMRINQIALTYGHPK